MRIRIFLIVLIFSTTFNLNAQGKIEIVNIGFHSLTKSKTFDYILNESIRNEFFSLIDSISFAKFEKKLNYNNDTRLNIDQPDAFDLMNIPYQFRKKDFTGHDNTAAFLSLDISERPLNMYMQLKNVDSAYIKKFKPQKNIGIYQFDVKIARKDESIILNKHLYVLLARPDIVNFIGFEHPLYQLTPSGFILFLKNSLSMLMDYENEAELIQITAPPAYVKDNFIQTTLENKTKIPTKFNKGIVQFNNKGLQALRFLEPGFEPIILKGKKTTSISNEIREAIFRERPKDYIYFWEEGRDIYANKNFKAIAVCTIAKVSIAEGFDKAINRKSGLPLAYLDGNYHCLLIDKDTVARFSIKTEIMDSSKKVFYNQLLNPFNKTNYFNNINDIASGHTYQFEINGFFQNKPFRILISGLNGSSSIKEIFYNQQLVCITQGHTYPETISFLDLNLSNEITNPLIWLSFAVFCNV